MTYVDGAYPKEGVPGKFPSCSVLVTLENEEVTLLPADTNGSKEYAQDRVLAYAGAGVIILCYDVNERNCKLGMNSEDLSTEISNLSHVSSISIMQRRNSAMCFTAYLTTTTTRPPIHSPFSHKTAFDNITKKWMAELERCAPTVPIILVGTKVEQRMARERSRCKYYIKWSRS